MNNNNPIDISIRIPLTKSNSTNDIVNLTNNVKALSSLTKSSSLSTINDIQKVDSTCTINTSSIGNTTHDDDDDGQIQELQEYYRNYNNLDARRNFSFSDSKAIIRNIIKVSSSLLLSLLLSLSLLLLLSIKDHKQTLQLLYQLLPQKVVSRLRNGQQILPEKFDNVTSNTTIYYHQYSSCY